MRRFTFVLRARSAFVRVWQRLQRWRNVPDVPRVLGDGAVARELTRRGDVQNAFLRPCNRILNATIAARTDRTKTYLEQFGHSFLAFDVTLVIREEHVAERRNGQSLPRGFGRSVSNVLIAVIVQ